MKRYFKRTSIYCGKSNVISQIAYYMWSKQKGLYVVFNDGLKFKSEYTLKELLSKEKPEGYITEVSHESI